MTRLISISLLLLLNLLAVAAAQQCTSSDPSTCADSPTTSSLPPDFEDPCRDSQEHCKRWSIAGECRANPTYMNEACPRSCGICQPLKKEEADNVTGAEKDDEGRDVCRDEVLECAGFAADGECLINPDYMRRDNCKYSCWVCVDPGKDAALGVDEDTIAKKLLYADMNLGRNQLIRDITEGSEKEDPMTPAAHDAVRATIAKMEQYARNVMTSPNVHPKARERCRNEFRMCAEWASRGSCQPAGHPKQPLSDNEVVKSAAKDVLFMMNMCPLACRMCEEIPSLACAGKRHPYAEPVVEEEGGLNAYFQDLKKGNEKTTFVSQPEEKVKGNENDSYVVVLPDAIADKEADDLLFLGESIGYSSSDSAFCEGQAACTTDKLEQDNIYNDIMSRIADLANTTLDYLEPMTFFRHKSNDATDLKHNYDLSGTWKPAGPRVLSFIIFLSDHGSNGGQIGFPYLNWLFIQPKKGSVVLLPNVMNENAWEMDPLTSYEYFGLDEEGDEMYVANVNVRLHNWTDANYRGCA